MNFIQSVRASIDQIRALYNVWNTFDPTDRPPFPMWVEALAKIYEQAEATKQHRGTQVD